MPIHILITNRNPRNVRKLESRPPVQIRISIRRATHHKKLKRRASLNLLKPPRASKVSRELQVETVDPQTCKSSEQKVDQRAEVDPVVSKSGSSSNIYVQPEIQVETVDPKLGTGSNTKLVSIRIIRLNGPKLGSNRWPIDIAEDEEDDDSEDDGDENDDDDEDESDWNVEAYRSRTDFKGEDIDIKPVKLEVKLEEVKPNVRLEEFKLIKDEIRPNNLELEPQAEHDSPLPDEIQPEEDEPRWQSSQQLVRFRDISKIVADNWLKESKIKLDEGFFYTRPTFLDFQRGRDAFDKGKKGCQKVGRQEAESLLS